MTRRDVSRRIQERLQEAAMVKLLLAESAGPAIERIAGVLIRALKGGRKIVLFGNGGSAADAQHIAAELEGRFERERRPWPALALTTNTSALTAIGNDYGYEIVFERLVRAHVRKGDVAIGLSTSGNSPNVVAGLRAAKRLGAETVAFTGVGGGRVAKAADHVFRAPSERTAHIQECHITVGHILCEIVERALIH
ncbi:MAG: D-sedoheptulose 7-phosphate isomerase [Planctomycetes bacterium]|nr:D-sedoheptulose 7-phosphate isomerase [Planctomycetota bacterium]